MSSVEETTEPEVGKGRRHLACSTGWSERAPCFGKQGSQVSCSQTYSCPEARSPLPDIYPRGTKTCPQRTPQESAFSPKLETNQQTTTHVHQQAHGLHRFRWGRSMDDYPQPRGDALLTGSCSRHLTGHRPREDHTAGPCVWSLRSSEGHVGDAQDYPWPW